MTADAAAMVKCVIWDLDGTLWEGTLVEGGAHVLRPGAAAVIRTLDERGVLHSIVSKNPPDPAVARLRELGVAEYFLYPRMSWQPKSELVAEIATRLNIGLDTVLFVDDSPFERAEVEHTHPQVRCVDSADLVGLLDRPDLNPPVTGAARHRRRYYQEAEQRRDYEESFTGPKLEFLRSLGMRLVLAPATEYDLPRAAELTQRTHQLNTTGLVFSSTQLADLMQRPDQRLLVASLTDRFGSYGVVGLVLLGLVPTEMRIRLFLMSCRVMGRNIGGAILTHLAHTADAQRLALTADFLPNEVNRPMYLVYRLAGFQDTGRVGGVRVLRLRAGACRELPDYVDLTVPASGMVAGAGPIG